MDTLYWIWLQTALGCGNAAADAVLEHNFSPRELYHASEAALSSLACFTPQQIYKMKHTSFEQYEQIAEQCAKRGFWILTADMEEYPERLRNIYQSPLLLYGVGNCALLSKDLLLTMVGSRDATASGEYSAMDMASDLVGHGFGIVSGMAVGIDSYSHKGALNMGGDTIGVAGCGLDIDYPTNNGQLRGEIARKGAIISEYPPGTLPSRTNFPIRNRILSGLTLGTIVVEAGYRSGSLITAELALEQGRDVYTMPTDLYNRKGLGNLGLIRQGAKVLTCAQDAVEEYLIPYWDKITERPTRSQIDLRRGFVPQKKREDIDRKNRQSIPLQKEATIKLPQVSPPSKEKQQNEAEILSDELSLEQKTILECIEEQPCHVEEIMAHSGMTMQEVLAILSELEIYGVIEALPGKQFAKTNLH